MMTLTFDKTSAVSDFTMLGPNSWERNKINVNHSNIGSCGYVLFSKSGCYDILSQNLRPNLWSNQLKLAVKSGCINVLITLLLLVAKQNPEHDKSQTCHQHIPSTRFVTNIESSYFSPAKVSRNWSILSSDKVTVSLGFGTSGAFNFFIFDCRKFAVRFLKRI